MLPLALKRENEGAVRCEDKPKYIVNENTHEFISTRKRTHLCVWRVRERESERKE